MKEALVVIAGAILTFLGGLMTLYCFLSLLKVGLAFTNPLDAYQISYELGFMTAD